jgi:hypothetical protein
MFNMSSPLGRYSNNRRCPRGTFHPQSDMTPFGASLSVWEWVGSCHFWEIFFAFWKLLLRIVASCSDRGETQYPAVELGATVFRSYLATGIAKWSQYPEVEPGAPANPAA